MKKIWTKSVFQYNKKTKKYELNQDESEFILLPDDAPIIEMKGGSSGPSTVTNVTNTSPWGPQQDWLKKGFEEAYNAFINDRSLPSFSGDTELAQRMIRERALRGADLDLAKSASGLLDRTIAGDYLTGGAGFDAALNAARNKINPMVDSAFARGGRSGSGLAATAKEGALADAFAGLYNQERERQMKSAALAPEVSGFINSQPYIDAGQLAASGSSQDAMNEAIRNERRRRIAEYMGAISGNYGSSSTSTATTSTPSAPWWQRALMGAGGGGLAGYSIGGPWGAFGGAGLGLLNAWG